CIQYGLPVVHGIPHSLYFRVCLVSLSRDQDHVPAPAPLQRTADSLPAVRYDRVSPFRPPHSLHNVCYVVLPSFLPGVVAGDERLVRHPPRRLPHLAAPLPGPVSPASKEDNEPASREPPQSGQ